MINKQSLWFLTLFSLILVLSVYYITMPNELLLTNNSNYLESEKTNSEVNNETSVTVSESELLVAMRVNLEEERSQTIADLRTTLTNEEATSQEKNNAYEQIKYITDLKGQEEAIEEKLKKEFSLECFVKVDNNEVKVVAIKDKHDTALANNIMKSVQAEFKNKVYVTVKFEK
ncbi:MAG: SpoIIIAH-like family protein [Tenericutes bacterium]|nr:SpoIIIAH-like family protein [Mycoplasmatota bacterium]